MNESSPIQPRLLSKINERLVLRMIQERGPSTRAEMSKSIGITFPTVAKAVSSLLESKLLEEYEEASIGRGRPAKRLRLASENSQIIGVAIDGTECKVASASLNGEFNEGCSLSFPTPTTYDSLLIHITSNIKKLMPTNGKVTLGVGLSVPAIIDYQDQRVVLSANLPLINGKTVGKDLQSLLGLECLVVRDSHALSLSERLHGNGGNDSSFAMLDLCGGVGLGLMIDGQFLTGDNGFAGELGHITITPNGELCPCGKKGCLETVASEWALEARMSLLLRRSVKISEILEMYRTGDTQVEIELEKMCENLALGVAYVINIVNPGKFYVYGRLFKEHPQLLDLLVEKAEHYALKPSFNSCKFEHASGGILDGTIASVINCLTDSLVPDLDGYVRFSGAGNGSSSNTFVKG